MKITASHTQGAKQLLAAASKIEEPAKEEISSTDAATHSLAFSIDLVAWITAMLMTLALPFGYFLLNYQQQRGAIESEAASLSLAASHIMRDKASFSENDLVQIQNLTELQPRPDVPTFRRIMNVQGDNLGHTSITLNSPLLVRSARIADDKVIIGQVEITNSLRPLVIQTLFITLPGFLLGWIVFTLLRIFPFRALRLAAEEIDVRKQTEAKLKESLGLLTATLESTADGIMAQDDAGRIVMVNQRFMDMWKIPSDVVASRADGEVLRIMCQQIFDAKLFADKLQSLRKQGDAHSRELLTLSDGRIYEWHSTPQRKEGKGIGRISSFHDISELRRAEALLTGEKSVFEMIVNGLALRDALCMLARNIEEQSGAMFCSILFRSERGRNSFAVAAPSLTPAYVSAIEVSPVIPTAQESSLFENGERDSYECIGENPAWDGYCKVVAGFGVVAHACSPVRSANGDLLGIILTHYRSDYVPHSRDRELVLLSVNLARITIERKLAEAKLDNLAHFDSLTGLPNRALFLDRLAQAKARADRERSKFAVMFLDLDRFKNINDTLGHHVGDALLKAVAERLRGSVRAQDTVARLGGDEFTVILEEVRRIEDAALVADKIIDALAPPCMLSGHEVFMTTSVGITMYPSDGDNLETLLRNADTAMYRAKQEGRNHYQFYAKEMNALSLDRLEMENSLRRGLERSEFELYYQPKVNLRTGRIVGAEVLLRWNHPERGMVSPAEFVPILEETGLINPVGEWVLRSTCIQAKAWQDAGLPFISFAVNLSPRQFQRNDLADFVACTLEETGLSPEWLALEITESMLIQDVDHTAETLERIRAMGVLRIDVDDFGTGYSSLSRLKRFPINALKLDQSFVRGIPADEEDCAISIAVLSMAKGLKVKVIAEGVETEQQRAFLLNNDCDEAQGYLFGRPMSANDFQQRLAETPVLRLIQA